jgi:histone H3
MMVERILSIFCLFLIVLSSETRLLEKTNFLSAFASDSSRQLDILRHDGDSLGVDRAQVGVFEQANQVRFGRFLQRQDRGGLESQVSLEILGDFSDQTLERQLSDEQFRGLLVLSDFSQRDGTRAVSVRLLDATSRRRGFARGLSRELLSRGFATGGFTSSLFGTSHCV